MGNAFAKSGIEIIKAQEAEKKSSLGKYLNKYIAPRHLYIIEQVPNLMASCLYHISKPMLVFSSKVGGAQLLMEAAESEVNAHPSKSGKNDPNGFSNDIIIGKKLSELEKRPIWIDDSESLMAMNLYARCLKLRMEHNLQVVVMDDYLFLVDDFFQEIPDELKLTMLQSLSEKLGIAIIAQNCPIDETKEVESKNNTLIFHNKWWDDTPKSEQEKEGGSIYDYWEQ
jgi:replicative DNA helicase